MDSILPVDVDASFQPASRIQQSTNAAVRQRSTIWPLVANACVAAMLYLSIAPRRVVAQDADGDAASRRIARHICAGCPQCIAPWARPSIGSHESGYHVGGGAHLFGDARCNHEGTWGWDYHGRLFEKRIWLGWHHGRRDQGGVGAYRTDGAKFPFHE